MFRSKLKNLIFASKSTESFEASKIFFRGALLSMVFANIAIAEPSSAEHDLERIKRQLVDLALQTDIRLRSSAFLDSDGILHEASVMSSNADIRGIRVLEYLEEAGIRTESIDANIVVNSECSGSIPPDIRRQTLVRASMDMSYDGDLKVGDHYLSELLKHSEGALLKFLAGSLDWQASSDNGYQSTYDMYMSSGPIDRANYRLDVTIREKNATHFSGSVLNKKGQILQSIFHSSSKLGQGFLASGFEASYDFLVWGNPHLPEIEFNQSWPKQALEYELTLVDRATEFPIWTKSLPLYYPQVDRGYKKDDIPLKVKRQIADINEELIDELSGVMNCKTDHYPLKVVAGRDDKFKIYAGRLSGVNIGDQFLISGDANILTQALSTSGLSGLGLAEVESISNRTALLRHIAGPKPKGLGGISNSVAIYF